MIILIMKNNCMKKHMNFNIFFPVHIDFYVIISTLFLIKCLIIIIIFVLLHLGSYWFITMYINPYGPLATGQGHK